MVCCLGRFGLMSVSTAITACKLGIVLQCGCSLSSLGEGVGGGGGGGVEGG